VVGHVDASSVTSTVCIKSHVGREETIAAVKNYKPGPGGGAEVRKAWYKWTLNSVRELRPSAVEGWKA